MACPRYERLVSVVAPGSWILKQVQDDGGLRGGWNFLGGKLSSKAVA
jgi:hypothetical protein